MAPCSPWRSRLIRHGVNRRLRPARAPARPRAPDAGARVRRATTGAAMAARAGLPKVTLYRYVKSKDELLSLVFERTIDSFRAGLAEIIGQRLPADEKLRRIVRYQVALLASHLPFLKVFFAEEAGLPAPMAARAARARREYDSAIERAYRDGVDEGLFRDLPPTLVVFGILGMCNWLHEWYKP